MPAPAQIRANASAFAGKAVTLDAAGLAERGPATVERSALFHFIERREKLIHLPIANELLIRFHLADPIAEKSDGSLIHHRD